MKKKRVNLWLVLPEELISQIMASSGLDFKSMIKCMGVCKQWRNLVSDLISTNPLLTQGQDQFLVYESTPLRFSALDDKTHQIAWTKTLDDSHGGLGSPPWGKHNSPRFFMSSCNGLVCLVGSCNKDIYICNPMTGECISLTTPECCWFSSISRYELGFCPSSNEYKLTTFRCGALEIYTLGSSSGWRSVPSKLSKFDIAVCAVRVGGVFHWLVETRNILTLDLAKEVFGSIPLPRLEGGKRVYQLECMDQCLVVTAGYDPPLRYDPPLSLEIWMRKEDKLSDESVWTKNWVIDAAVESLLRYIINYRYLRPRKLSSNGRIFMTYFRTYLYSYDPRDKLVRHCYSGRESYILITHPLSFLQKC